MTIKNKEMTSTIVIEIWNKSFQGEYVETFKSNIVPRIGERISFELPDENGVYVNSLYVVDIVNQFIGNEHIIKVMVDENLDNVSNFHYYSVNGEKV